MSHVVTPREPEELWFPDFDAVSVTKVKAERVPGHPKMRYVKGMGTMTIGVTVHETRDAAIEHMVEVISFHFESAKSRLELANNLKGTTE